MSDFKDIQSEALKRPLALLKKECEDVTIQVSSEINPLNIVRLKEQLYVLKKDINEFETEFLFTKIKNKLQGSNFNNKQARTTLQEIFKGCVNIDVKVYPMNLVC